MSGPLGTQWIVELNDCAADALEQVPSVRDAMLEAAREAHASMVGQDFHQFAPYGVSGVVVLAQSHMTIHTWPEHAYAAVDFFFCSDRVDVDAAVDVLRARFSAGRIAARKIHRDVATEPRLAPADAEASGSDLSLGLCLTDAARGEE